MKITYRETMSNCCAAGVLPGDICDECRKHCDVTTHVVSQEELPVGELAYCAYDEVEPRN